jgi:allophanate hydrolase subunit 1
MSDLEKIKIPILQPVPATGEDNIPLNPVVFDTNQIPENDFFFKINPPPEDNLKVKASVVIRLPLYSEDAIDTNVGAGLYSKKPDTPISFEEIYRNWSADDFAQYLTTTGVLSKAIRYALLYNYFGYPAANLNASKDSAWAQAELESTNFSPYKTDKRVTFWDVEYASFLTMYNTADYVGHLPFDWGTWNPHRFWVDNCLSFYQLGSMGQIPSFKSNADSNLGEEEVFFDLFSTKWKSGIDDSSYTPYRDIFSFLHGSNVYGDTSETIGGRSSFVEPIGVDAEDTSLIGTYSDPFLKKTELASIFNPSWDGYAPGDSTWSYVDNSYYRPTLNSIPRTFARAWLPSSIKNTTFNSSNIQDNSELLHEPGFLVIDQNEQTSYDDIYTYGDSINPQYAGGAPYTPSYNWKNTSSVLGTKFAGINSLDVLNGAYNPQAGGWYANLLTVNVTPYIETGEDSAKIPDSPTKFEYNNIASAYKLVPIGNDGESKFKYLDDPAQTLNEIYQKVFKYVRDVVPVNMIQHSVNSDKMKDLYPDYDSELNESDIIAKSQIESVEAGNEVKPSILLKKFRLGHELQPQKVTFDPQSPDLDSVAPEKSSEFNSLGYTHTIGTFDLNQGSAFHDIINKSSQTEEQKYFRNKISCVFKSWWHEDYFLMPHKSISSKGAIKHINIKTTISDHGEQYGTPLFYPPPENTTTIPESIKEGFDKAKELSAAVSELKNTYLLSSRLLSFIYLKKPSGFIASQSDPNDPFVGGVYGKTVSFDVDSFKDGYKNGKAGPIVPTILDFSNESILTSQLQGLSFSIYSQDLFMDKYDSPSDQNFINDIIEGNASDPDYGFGEDLNKAQTMGHFDFIIDANSNFALPVWKYDYQSEQDLREINWPLLVGSNKKSAEISALTNENPSLKNIRNYGIPQWVTSLRIYPALDSDTKISGYRKTNFEVLDGIFNDHFKHSSVSMEETATGAMKIVVEPTQHTQPANFNDVRKYVEIRYVTEIGIDERQLILDMVGQGVAALAGNADEYESIGFDISDLLKKSNGNLTDPELIDYYNSADYDIGAGLGADFSGFPPLIEVDPDNQCPDYPPKEVIDIADQIFSSNPDPFACTSYVCLLGEDINSIALKEKPGFQADNIGYIKNNTVLKVLKEWVNGKGDYNEVEVVDPTAPSSIQGKVGYVKPKYLKPIRPYTKETDGPTSSDKIFFDQFFPNLKYGNTIVTQMSEMSKALIPTWWKNNEPYYHTEDGEYWVTVEMPQTCVFSRSELVLIYEEAKRKGLKYLLDFYGKTYSELDITKFISSHLAVKAEAYHIDSRPGAKLKVLIKVGGIYLNAAKDKQFNLNKLKEESAYILSLDLRYFQTHLDQAVFSMNKLYLDVFSSDFYIQGFNFSEEARRLSFVPAFIKKAVLLNGYNYTAGSDTQSIVNIGFTSDYKLKFMSFIPNANSEEGSEEALLYIGFDFYKEMSPFNLPYTMSLLHHHRDMKNPLLQWRVIFDEWLPSPKPKVIPKSIARASSGFTNSGQNCRLNFQWPAWGDILMGIAERLDTQLDLNPRFDLGAFQFNLLQFFPPCPKPPPGKGSTFFKFLSEIDGQTNVANNLDFIDAVVDEAQRTVQYVGDFISSGAALKDIRAKIFDLDDLYAYVLDYITPEVLYSKICKCFLSLMDVDEIGVPNLSMTATGASGGLNLNPSTILNNPSEIIAEGQSWDFEGSYFNKKETILAEDLFCSFCFNIPSIFFRLPTLDLLKSFIDAIKALLEFALAQILLELIAALLDALLTCPELECSPDAPAVKDYGAQNLNQLLDSYGTVSFEENMAYCGIEVGESPDQLSVASVKTILNDVSKILTTNETAALFDGGAPEEVLKAIQVIFEQNEQFNAKFSSITGIADFFACIGSRLKPEMFDILNDESLKKYDDPLVCGEIQKQTMDQLIEKCGELPIEDINQVLKNNLSNDLDKYKDIAKIIRDNDDLSSQLPPIFSDGGGDKAILSQVNAETANYSLEKTLETLFATIQTQLMYEIKDFTNAKKRILVKDSNERLKYESSIGATAIWENIGSVLGFGNKLEFYNKLAGVPSGEDEFYDISKIIRDMPKGIDLENIENNELLIEMPYNTFEEPSFIKLTLPKPLSVEGTTELKYSNQYKIDTARLAVKLGENLGGDSEAVNYMSYNTFFDNTGISEDLLQHLNEYALDPSNFSPQAQYFGNVLLKNIGINPEVIPLSGDGEMADSPLEKIKLMFQKNVYFATLSSVFISMATKCSQTNLASQWVEPLYPKVEGGALLGIGAALDALGLGTITADALNPDLWRWQVENLKLVDKGVGPNNFKKTFIDFNYATQLAKQKYDFSIQYDPNAEHIGMPHFSLMEGIVSSMMQSFIGETCMKGVFVLPSYPKEVFQNELMCNFVLSGFKDWLNSSDPEFKIKWKSVITRMAYDRPEFTPDEGYEDKKPILPGENPFGGGFGEAGVIRGEMYDAEIGKKYIINSWEDATLFYIRSNLKRPVNFVKDRLNEAKLKDVAMDQELNPSAFLTYPFMKEVHRSTFFLYEDSEPPSSTSIVNDGQPGTLDIFKNGKFFYQYYFRIEDFEPGEEGYNEYISQRKAIIYDPDAFTGPSEFQEIINAQDLPDEDINNPFENPHKGAAKWLLDALGEDAELPSTPYIVWGGSDLDPVYQNTDHSLKSILNSDAVDRLFELLSNPKSNSVLNYGLTPEEQSKPFADFFKSIKIGVRLCYAVSHTTEGVSIDGNPFSIMHPSSGMTDIEYNHEFFLLHQELKNSFQSIAIQDPDFAIRAQQEKYFSIIEIGTANVGDAIVGNESTATHTSHIFPVVSSEIDITSIPNTPFQIPVYDYIEFNQPGNKSVLSRIREYSSQGSGLQLRNQCLLDIFNQMETRGMFNYSFPLYKMATILMYYNVIGIENDKNVFKAFDQTKAILKSHFETIYDVKGRSAYKYKQPFISNKGGPAGVSSSGAEEE